MIGPPRIDLGADLDALARVPANTAMLEHLRTHAGPRTRRTASPWDIDGFELHSHPDLTERLEQLGAGLPGGGRPVGIYGYSALVDPDGVIRVVALGNAGFALRLRDGAIRAAVEANSRFRWTTLAPDWIGADAWPADSSLPVGTALVRRWIEAAFSEPAAAPGTA